MQNSQIQKGNAALIIVAIIAIAAGSYFIFFKDEGNPLDADVFPTLSPSASPASTSTPAATASPSVSPTATVSASVKSFLVLGSPFKFSVNEIKVKKGDTVKLTFKNTAGTHDWKVDEFNAATKMLQVGQEETIQFVANKTGTFEYYCSVGTHRQMGMKGTLIVE